MVGVVRAYLENIRRGNFAAAAQYLAMLLGHFGRGVPLLALAAYNAGESKVWGALWRQANADFFALCEQGVIPEKAATYVPRILAAAIIGSHPERYGLE